MEFIFPAQKSQNSPTNIARPLRFIEGPLNRFDGASLLVGYGSAKALPRRKAIMLMRKASSFAKQNQIKSFEIDFKEIRTLAAKDIGDAELAELIAEAFMMVDYEHVAYKHAPKEGFIFINTVVVRNASAAVKNGFAKGAAVGNAVNAARELSNTPGGDMTPEKLAEAALKAAEGTKAKVKVLGRAEMTELGMGAILGIAKGSAEEPQFIVVEYWGTDRSKKPVVLVGKGVTFDTGGLNIKPGDHMYEMHMDMSGGAAVIQAVILAATLGLKKNVVALVPAVENNLAHNAVRPGDVLKSMSGKTIEILNTDAEGRVILADAITYAKKYNPAAVVDVATLTGAALTALGTVASAYMTNNEKLIPSLMELGEESGDYIWPLPLWDEYDDMVKGTFGDVPNISTMGNSREGGVIAGGKFLEVFAKELECPWVHLDIAPVMTSRPGDFLAKGAAGAPVRLLLKLIENGVK
ncbi:MAG TPA: leucyl aminopeptidase [Candidatus Paceibacterota bacterium]|nr:leucyl aminopeptidase [Candidatus Paceibacterota bacterium]